MNKSTPSIHDDQFIPFYENTLKNVLSKKIGKYYYSKLLGPEFRSEDILYHGKLRDDVDPDDNEVPSGWKLKGHLFTIDMLIKILGNNEGIFLKEVQYFETISATAGIQFMEMFPEWVLHYLSAKKRKAIIMRYADITKERRKLNSAKHTFLKHCDGLLLEDDLKSIAEHIDAAMKRSKPELKRKHMLFLYKLGFLGIDAPLPARKKKNKENAEKRKKKDKFSKENENLNSLIRFVDKHTNEQIPAAELSRRIANILEAAGVSLDQNNLRSNINTLRKHFK